MFMGSTLQSHFYEHMLDRFFSKFVDIVIIGERIKLRLKTDKIVQGAHVAMNVKKIEFLQK